MKTSPALFALFGIALGGLVAVSGCARNEPEEPAATASADSSTAGQAIDDATITAKVKAALASEAQVNGTDISVTTNQGQVTLTGAVPQPQIKRAEQIARSIEGVREVDNKLEPARASS